jgi:hypothetical protein
VEVIKDIIYTISPPVARRNPGIRSAVDLVSFVLNFHAAPVLIAIALYPFS